MDARRLAYLDAMGIEVWRPRTAREKALSEGVGTLVLGDGDSDILCVALNPGEAGCKLANDISEAMRTRPLWSWPPDPSGAGGDGISLAAAVAEKLLTRVLVFGEELAGTLFGNEVPEVIAGARVHVVPSLARLDREREAKRILWNIMREQGMAAKPASGGSGS